MTTSASTHTPLLDEDELYARATRAWLRSCDIPVQPQNDRNVSDDGNTITLSNVNGVLAVYRAVETKNGGVKVIRVEPESEPERLEPFTFTSSMVGDVRPFAGVVGACIGDRDINEATATLFEFLGVLPLSSEPMPIDRIAPPCVGAKVSGYGLDDQTLFITHMVEDGFVGVIRNKLGATFATGVFNFLPARGLNGSAWLAVDEDGTVVVVRGPVLFEPAESRAA